MNDYYIALFLDWFKDNPSPILSNDEYPYILKKDVKVNLQQLHHLLIDKNYFKQSTIKEVLTTLKVKELKDILSHNGIKPTGRRNANMLLISNLDENLIAKYLPKNYKEYYTISKKGLDFLEHNQDFILVKKYYKLGVSPSEYIKFRTTDHSFFETCEKVLKSQLYEVSKLKTSYSKNVTYRQLFRLYDIYGKHEKALIYALASLYVDLSGDEIIMHLEFGGIDLFHPIPLNSRINEVTNEFNFIVSPQDETINVIYKNRDFFSPKMIDAIYKIELSLNLCSKELFSDIVQEIFQGSFDKKVTQQILKDEFINAEIIVNEN